MKNKHSNAVLFALPFVRLKQVKNLTLFGFIFLAFIFIKCKNGDEASPFDNANGKKGGIYYDTFWAAEGGYDQTNTEKIKKLTAFADFFKCKQCHGWDLDANRGSYIGRAPTKTRPSVSSYSLKEMIKTNTPEQLFNLIKTGSNPSLRRPFSDDLSAYDPNTNKVVGDKMPNYGELLSDEQIWDIVKFFKEESIDVTTLYDYTTTGAYPTGKISFSNIGKDGDVARGKTLFVSKGCSAPNCHGANGAAILVDNNAFTIGGFIRAKPQEAQHKIKFGQLGSTMTAVNVTQQELKDIYKAIVTDSIAFPLKK